MKKPLTYFVILCFILPYPGLAQQAIIDSLKARLPNTPEDTNKVQLYNNLSFYTYQVNPDQSLDYAEKAIELSKELEYKRGEIVGHFKKATAYLTMGNYDAALEEVNWTLKQSQSTNFQGGVRSSLNLLSILYLYKGDLINALNYSNQGLDLAIKNEDSLDMGYAFISIGNIYLDGKDLENAAKYYKEALAIFQELKMDREVVSLYNNLSGVETDTAKVFTYATKAVELAKKLDLPNHLSYAYVNLGNYYWFMKNQPQKALPLHLKGLALAEQTNDYFQKTEVTTDLGSLYKDLGMPDSAFYYSDNGLALAREQGMDEQIQESLDYIATYQASKGNFKLAYEASIENRVIADSLYSKGLADAMADADTRYETSKKETQLAAQELQISKQQNQQNQIIIAALALLAIAAGIFQYFFYRQKRKKQAAEIALQAEQVEADRLRELDQLKSTFFTNISHELRTPLTLVAAPLEDALESAKPGPLKNHLQLARTNTQKLLTLVNEILDLSKLEAGKIGASLSDLNLNSFCRRVLFSFESLAELRGIKLNFESGVPDQTHIQSDAEKLEKVLNNLLSNAVKFTNSGGNITLQLSQNSSNYHLSVKDTGSGIPAEELPRIFDRFYQSSAPDAPLQGGSGIGLALAKELSQLLGGDLQVESQLGEGSIFSLSLPIASSQGTSTTIIASEEPEFQNEKKYVSHYAPLLLNGQKPRLLIVEDNPEMSQYLANSLGKDYHCTIAPDGLAALNKMKSQSFDLITSDVMMPQMDGFTFREKVNENENWKQIPFIMLTARSLEEDKLRGFQLGVDDYLTKPFSRKELEARIHNLLVNKLVRDTYEAEAEEEQELSVEEQLLKDAEAFVLQKLDDPQLRVDDLAAALNYSSRHLGRVFRKLCGLTPVNFILELRLQKARQLLESRRFQSVAEVRYEIGIESASYFSTKFTERFGKNPREYLS